MKKEDCCSYEVNESGGSYRSSEGNFVYEIKKTLGVLRKSNSGWTRELNVVAWNNNSPKYDIRDWSPDHEKMTRGITFTKSEAEQICKWLSLDSMNGEGEDNAEEVEEGLPF